MLKNRHKINKNFNFKCQLNFLHKLLIENTKYRINHLIILLHLINKEGLKSILNTKQNKNLYSLILFYDHFLGN